MLQNNWVSEKLILEHQWQLMEKADRVQRAQDAQQAPQAHKSRRLLAKLRAEMHNL